MSTQIASERTPQQTVATMILGRPVEDWLREQRQAGQSWRDIALELLTATDGRVRVTDVTVRAWGLAAGLPTGRVEHKVTAA